MFKGRLNRTGFVLGNLYLGVPMLVAIILYVISIIAIHDSGAIHSMINIVFFLFGAAWCVFNIVASLGMIIRRWHDMNKTGWLALLHFVPVVNLVTFLILLFAPGTQGPNDYGFPKSSRKFKDVLLGSRNPLLPGDEQPPQGTPKPGTYGAGPM